MTFPHSGEVWRKTASNNKYIFASLGSIQCFLQPLDEASAEAYGITFTKGSHAYVPFSADVLEADRLIIGSVKYGVKGVKEHNYGSLKHKRLILERM